MSSLEGYGSTVELHPRQKMMNDEIKLELPTPSVSLIRIHHSVIRPFVMVDEAFEPSKALPSDLQSDPFDHSGNPPLQASGGTEPTTC